MLMLWVSIAVCWCVNVPAVDNRSQVLIISSRRTGSTLVANMIRLLYGESGSTWKGTEHVWKTHDFAELAGFTPKKKFVLTFRDTLDNAWSRLAGLKTSKARKANLEQLKKCQKLKQQDMRLDDKKRRMLASCAQLQEHLASIVNSYAAEVRVADKAARGHPKNVLVLYYSDYYDPKHWVRTMLQLAEFLELRTNYTSLNENCLELLGTLDVALRNKNGNSAKWNKSNDMHDGHVQNPEPGSGHPNLTSFLNVTVAALAKSLDATIRRISRQSEYPDRTCGKGLAETWGD